MKNDAQLEAFDDESDELLMRLATLPPSEFIVTAKRLRSSQDSLDELVRLSRGSPDLLSVSDHATSQAILQFIGSRLEYEITVSHPHIYPQPRETINGTILPSGHDVELACFGLTDLSYAQYGTGSDEVFGPSGPPTYIDSRLRRLDISHWTRVHVSDNWAAQALSLYFEVDHAVATLVDADLFIRDLVARRTEFCSRLLVNSLMFWASVSVPQCPAFCTTVLMGCSKACPSSTTMLR